MSIGDNIKKYRTEKQISQEKLAVKLDISSRTLQSYESNKTSPTFDALKKIAVELDIPFYKLIENDESLSAEDIERIKGNIFNFIPPSDIRNIKIATRDLGNSVGDLIRIVNYMYCDNKYDLEKIIVENAAIDITGLVTDIIKNRLEYYSNLANKK